MYYFVVEISSLKDGSTPCAVTRKDSLREAIMLYHQVMSAGLANADVVKVSCAILDESCNKVDIDPGVYDGE